MDLCKNISQKAYENILKHLSDISKSVFDDICIKAVGEEKKKNKENGRKEDHLIVSGDGSWKKRDFNSNYCVTTLIGNYCGKIVDLVVKSIYCHACALWNKRERPNMMIL